MNRSNRRLARRPPLVNERVERCADESIVAVSLAATRFVDDSVRLALITPIGPVRTAITRAIHVAVRAAVAEMSAATR